MRNLVGIPLLLVAVIMQSAIVPAFSLLSGYPDIVLVMLAAWALQEGVTTAYQWALLAGLMISLVSHLPWFIYVGSYLGVVVVARLLQRRVWQVPLLAMFTVTFLGTMLMHLLTYAYLQFSGGSLSLGNAMGLITLPSLLLNLLIAIPMFSIMRDLARWVFPVPEAA